MKPSIEPLKWEPLRGAKGIKIARVERGSIVHDSESSSWFVEVQRGCLSRNGGDRWGPLRASIDDEAGAIAECGLLMQHLKRAGWFNLPQPLEGAGWDIAAMRASLRRLPLSVRGIMPRHWRLDLDEERAAEGLARNGHVLRIAGVDVHLVPEFSNPVEASIVPLESSAKLAFVPAGRRPSKSDTEQFHLAVGPSGLDALIDFLLDARRNVASAEVCQQSMRAVIDNAGPTDSADAVAQRVARMQQRKIAIEALYTKLFDLSPANLHALLTIADTMLAGADVQFSDWPAEGAPVTRH